MRTLIKATALALALSTAPAAAYGVYVTSYHGNGSQYRNYSANNGAGVNGNLKSVQGYPVYYEGKINWARDIRCPSSTNDGRYTGNITSRSAYPADGYISTGFPSGNCISTSVNSRVSRDITAAPDPSGNWSSNY